MGACQGKWSCLRPSGSEHACFPASPATLTSLLLPDLPFLPLCSEMDIPVPWSFFSQPCHDYSFPPFRSQSLSEIMSPPSFSLPYIVINLFFFFLLSMHITVFDNVLEGVSPPLDFRSHEGRVLVYLVCPSLWLAPICSRVWGLVRRAAFQVPPLLPHRCSQRWAGSLPSTPALPFTHLWWDSYLCILSFSSLNWTSKIFLSQL